MTTPPDHIVIPYTRFLECQDRRRTIAAALTRPTPPTNDADPKAVPDYPHAPISTAWSTS
jgi:hypothetical protein